MKGWTIVSQGSTGKTSLTVNLGLIYAMQHPEEKIVIVDFSFQKPDVAAFLDITTNKKDDPTKTLDDLYPLLVGFETIILEHFLANPFAEVPNFYVVSGFVQGIHSHNQLNREQWAYFFSTLRDFADLAIFDTDRNINHLGFQYLLGETDTFFVTTLPDPLLNKHTLRLLNYLASKGRSKDVRLLLMRGLSGQAYGAKHISESIQRDVDYIIPDISRKDYDRQVFNARPLVFKAKHPYTYALKEMVSCLDENQITKDKRRKTWNIPILNSFKMSRNT